MYLINLHNHLFMYLPNKLVILLQNPNIPKMHFLIKSILFLNILNIYTFFIKFHTFDEGGSKKHSVKNGITVSDFKATWKQILELCTSILTHETSRSMSSVV